MIVWDTEFTSWQGCDENGWKESNGQYKELIQVGAYKIDNSNYSIIDSLDLIVRPRINTELSDYITDLTGITQSMIDDRGIDFVEALDRFEDFVLSHDCYSWENDLDVLIYNIDLYDCDRQIENTGKYNDIREIFGDLGVPFEEYDSGSVYKHYDIDAKIKQHYAVEDSLSMVLALQKANNR